MRGFRDGGGDFDALEPLARGRLREAPSGAAAPGAAAGRAARRAEVPGARSHAQLVQDVVLRWVESGPSEEHGSKHAAAPAGALLRSGAHLLLFLQALLPDGGGLNPGGALHFHLNRVTALYVVHLIATRRYELVPATRATSVRRQRRHARLLPLADAPRGAGGAPARGPGVPMEGEAGVGDVAKPWTTAERW